MVTYSKECQPVANAIAALKSDRAAIQADLHEASPPMKPALAAQIKALTAQIAQKQEALASCVQLHPYVPPPPAPTNPCLGIRNEVQQLQSKLSDEIRKAVASLQQELRQASSAQKAAIIAEIKTIRADIVKNSPLSKQIAAKKQEYDDCIVVNGGLPALDATVTGTAALQISNEFVPDLSPQTFTLALHFSDFDHRVVTDAFLSQISFSYSTPFGTSTTTVTSQGGSGTFDPKSNFLTLQLSLYFHHSLDVAGDSTLDMEVFTTKAIDASGNITGSGVGEFKGGFLGGDTCLLTIVGKIAPHP